MLFRVTKMIPMKTGELRHIREDLKALHMKTHRNVVMVTGLVQVEEVRDMIKKVGNMVIIREVPVVLQLSMIGVVKTVEYQMEIIRWKVNLLREPETWVLQAHPWSDPLEIFWEKM